MEVRYFQTCCVFVIKTMLPSIVLLQQTTALTSKSAAAASVFSADFKDRTDTTRKEAVY
jgi:hypothetical protein